MLGERPILVLATLCFAGSIAALAYLSVLGIVFVIPALVVGVARFALALHDGAARFAPLSSGFRDYGGSLRRMLPVVVCLMSVALPAGAFQAFALLSGDGALMLTSFLVGVAWNALLLYPLLFAAFLVAERDLGARDALGTAWRAARGARGRFAAASVATEFVAYSGVFALGVGLLVTGPFGFLMLVSAYRQVFEPLITSPAD